MQKVFARSNGQDVQLQIASTCLDDKASARATFLLEEMPKRYIRIGSFRNALNVCREIVDIVVRDSAIDVRCSDAYQMVN